MPANSTDIVNDALARLGISQITSLTDGSKQAQFASRMYDQTRDEVLALRDWTFAVKRATLSQAASGNSEWLYAYTLPADFLRLVQINNDEIGTIKHKFALEGNKIFTDSATLAVVYIAQITDVSLYSPLFVECLSIKLAAKLAGPLAGDRKMALEFLALFDKVAAMPQPGEQGGRSKRNKNGTLTAVEIANTALAYLGVAPITSLTDNSTQAQLADRFYDVTRDEVLAARPWTFALKRATLSVTATGGEWAYSHTLPGDYLRAVQINNDEIETISHKFALEGNKLLIDAPTVTLVYVARVTDIGLYSPLFVEALALKLAAKFAGPLTAGQPNNNAAATLVASYEKIIMTPQPGEQRKRSNRKVAASLSDLEIANAALAYVGASPISTFTDGSPQSQIADRFYEVTRDEVLAVRPWTFALQRVTLTGTTNASGSEWAYSHNLPSDHLRLVQIDEDEIETITHKFALEGSKLLSDSASLTIVYVARVTNVSLYSPLFVEALTLKLATKFAPTMTAGQANNNILASLMSAYEKTIVTPQAGEQRKRSNRKTGSISAVEIANMALAHIGIGPIVSLTDNSTQAQLVDRFYNATRDEVMALRPWTFATRRANLASTTNNSLSEWQQAYALPADYLRLVQINEDEVENITHKYAIEGTTLYCDENSVALVYVARITDATLYSPLFVEALALKLAMKLIGPLAQGQQNANMLTALTAAYEKTMATPQMGEQRKRSNRKRTNLGDVEVVNNALSMLGISPISSLSDSSTAAQLADRFYAPTRDEVLTLHPWNFAMKRATLTRGPTPSSQYAYSYVLPTDFIRLMQVNGYEINTLEDDYAVEGNLLLTNADTAKIRYVSRVTDVNTWPAIFSEAVTIKLASKLAGPLTQDRNVSVNLLQNYEANILSKGRLTNAFQNRAPISDMFAASRYVGSRGAGVGAGGGSGGGSGGITINDIFPADLGLITDP